MNPVALRLRDFLVSGNAGIGNAAGSSDTDQYLGLKDEKSWSEPDFSALWCGKVWFKVVGGQL